MKLPALKNKILPLLKRQGATKVALFGSFARGDENKASDIDVLVKFNRTKSLMELASLEYSLENNLGKRVDLLTYDSINPLLKKRILNEQYILYEKRS